MTLNTRKFSPVINLQTGISSDDSNPSGSSAGVAVDGDAPEVLVYISGGTSCTATLWLYNDLADAWCATQGVSISGNEVFLGYVSGIRFDVALTSVSGTYRIDYQLVNKDA